MLIVIWELMVPNSVAPSGLGGWWGAFNPSLAHGATRMWTFQGFWSLLIFKPLTFLSFHFPLLPLSSLSTFTHYQ